MTNVVKETVITNEDRNPVVLEKIIYYLFGILEVLLAFRLIFKLFGANQGSYFVSFIYRITSIFIFPFEGIFRRGVSQGIETASVLEPSTIVSLVVYMLLAWGIVKLIQVTTKEI